MERTGTALGCDFEHSSMLRNPNWPNLNFDLSGLHRIQAAGSPPDAADTGAALFTARHLEETCRVKTQEVADRPLHSLIEALEVDFVRPSSAFKLSAGMPSLLQASPSGPTQTDDATRRAVSQANVSEEQDAVQKPTSLGYMGVEHPAFSTGPLTTASTVCSVASAPLKTASMPSTTSTDGREGLDQTEVGVMHLWWGLIQDQLGTLSREIDSLRHSQTQLQARQTEAFMQQAESERVADTVARLAKLFEVEKQERIEGCEKIMEDLIAEQSSRTVAQEEYQHSLCRLQAALNDEASERQAAQRSQCDQVCQALETLREEFREEMDRQTSHLRHDLSREADARLKTNEDFLEHVRKLSASMENDRDSQGTRVTMLQLQLDSLTNEFQAEREDWSQKRGVLQEKIIQSLGQQEELLSKEKLAREAHEASLEARIDAESRKLEANLKHLLTDTCNREREQTKTLLGKARQILESDEALRERLQSLLGCEMVTRADFTSETARLWQALKTRAVVQPSTARAGSPVPSTARTGSPIRRFFSSGPCFSPCTTAGDISVASLSNKTTQSVTVLPGAPSRQAGNRNALSSGQLSFVGSVTSTSAVSSTPLSHR